MSKQLDSIDHVAIAVPEIGPAIDWYRRQFQCEVLYRDDSWALLQFSNIKMALVLPAQHPPHIGFRTLKAAEFGPLKQHRDGTKSVYISDPAGNSLELLATD